MAGFRIGWVQMLMAGVGMLLLGIWFVKFLFEFMFWSETGEFHLAFDIYAVAAVIGLFVSWVAWVWGLFTGVEIVRKASKPSS